MPRSTSLAFAIVGPVGAPLRFASLRVAPASTPPPAPVELPSSAMGSLTTTTGTFGATNPRKLGASLQHGRGFRAAARTRAARNSPMESPLR